MLGTILDPMDPPEPAQLLMHGQRVQVGLHGEERATVDGREWINVCDAEMPLELSSEVREQLQSLVDRHVPPAALVDEPRYIGSMLDESHRLRVGEQLPVRFLPPQLRTLLMSLERVAFDATLRVVTVARWRLAIPGPQQPLVAEARHWYAREAWQLIPFTVPPRGWWGVSGSFGEAWRAEVERLVVAGPEPIAQELYREASIQRTDQPRSALVMAVAAAEVGIVETARALLPDESVPSGSFSRLLDETLVQLAGRRPIAGGVLLPPAAMIDALHAARRLRNAIVHGPAHDPSPDAVDDALEAVRNLLLFLDFYAGHGWALATADARIVGTAARPLGLSAGDLMRAAWPDAATLSPLVHPAPPRTDAQRR